MSIIAPKWSKHEEVVHMELAMQDRLDKAMASRIQAYQVLAREALTVRIKLKNVATNLGTQFSHKNTMCSAYTLCDGCPLPTQVGVYNNTFCSSVDVTVPSYNLNPLVTQHIKMIETLRDKYRGESNG